MRVALPAQLRVDDARPVFFVVLVALMVALIVGDPGRIDRQVAWLRVLTGVLIGLTTVVNGASSVRLVIGIVSGEPFSEDAAVLLVSGLVIWLTNVIAFGLWYWDLDRGGAAARALGSSITPLSCSPRCRTRKWSKQAGAQRSWTTCTSPLTAPWHSARPIPWLPRS